MSNELNIFDQVERYFVGFDRLFDDIKFNSKFSFFNLSKKPYPPYNIQKISEFMSIIEIAAAGFSKEDLSVVLDNDILTISGVTPKEDCADDESEQYTYRGLSKRAFKRSFRLAESAKIENCNYENGLLKIHLNHGTTELKEPLKIEIK